MKNLKLYIDDSLQNIESVISRLENNNIDLQDFKNYLITQGLDNNVLFIGGPQILGSFTPFIHTYSSMNVKENKFLYTLLDMSKEGLIVSNVLRELESNKKLLGANVTMPYKIDIYNYLNNQDKLDESALLVGAVNVISKKNSNICGYNTDFKGIYSPIKSKLSDIELKEIKTGYIIGCGGAAKAGVVALLLLGITDIVILSRKKNIDLFNHFKKVDIKNILKDSYGITKDINIRYKEYDVINNDKISTIVNSKSIIINTLPFGFKDHLPKKSIIDGELINIKNNVKLFFDVVYDINYGDTPIIQECRELNIPICDGIDMLIGQAVKGFELWTNGGKIDINKINKLLR